MVIKDRGNNTVKKANTFLKSRIFKGDSALPLPVLNRHTLSLYCVTLAVMCPRHADFEDSVSPELTSTTHRQWANVSQQSSAATCAAAISGEPPVTSHYLSVSADRLTVWRRSFSSSAHFEMKLQTTNTNYTQWMNETLATSCWRYGSRQETNLLLRVALHCGDLPQALRGLSYFTSNV